MSTNVCYHCHGSLCARMSLSLLLSLCLLATPFCSLSSQLIERVLVIRPCLKGVLRVCGLGRRCPYHSTRLEFLPPWPYPVRRYKGARRREACHQPANPKTSWEKKTHTHFHKRQSVPFIQAACPFVVVIKSHLTNKSTTGWPSECCVSASNWETLWNVPFKWSVKWMICESCLDAHLTHHRYISNPINPNINIIFVVLCSSVGRAWYLRMWIPLGGATHM